MFEAFKCPKLGFMEPYREYKSFLDSPFAQNGGDRKWGSAVSFSPRLSARPCLFYIKLPASAASYY